ncbi:MAG: phosphatidylglycerophosphatase A [Desulfovibrionaceae bacterium]|nr:phosphatidylglycerophosphatase A [Desulfovibrionaceae bacterium]
MNKTIATVCATLFGSGYFPIASGTVGSAVTMPFIVLVAYYYGIWGISLATCVLFFIGVYATSIYTQGTAEHDPSSVVIDEAMGQYCTFIFISSQLQYTLDQRTVILYCLGFFFFRLFDTLKPYPACWADSSLHSAWGVMLDDLFAGIYAGIVLYLVSSAI